MWLASLSRREYGGGRIRATGTWTPEEIDRGYARLVWALEGVGDLNHERLFRMNITLCLHRAARPEEVEALPASWHGDSSGMAGGPVACIWSRGIPDVPSTRPCENPGRQLPDPDRPDLWIPLDCGTCEPCRARLDAVAHLDRKEP